MPYYYIDNDFNKAWGINNNLDQFVMNQLCEPIDNDKDWVVVVSLLIY